MHDLKIRDFGVSGITLNGASDVQLEDVDVGPSVGMADAPKLLATPDYFQALAVLRVVSGGRYTQEPKIQALQEAVTSFVDAVLRGEATCDNASDRGCKYFPFLNSGGYSRGS